MVVTNVTIPSIWGGTIEGLLLKNDKFVTENINQKTQKIICMHGWLDNLNSMLKLSEKLVNDRPNYEIFLYDRAGHGFSSHFPKGIEYTVSAAVQELRTVVLHLKWNKENFSFMGHSYGGVFALFYIACYPEEVKSLVLLDCLPTVEATSEDLFKVFRSRLDDSFKYHTKPPRAVEPLIDEKGARELVKFFRPGLTNEAADFLAERCIRPVKDGKVRITFDEAAKVIPIFPLTTETHRILLQSAKLPIFAIYTARGKSDSDKKTIDLFKENNPNFEFAHMAGSHHFQMININEIIDLITPFFDKYLK